MTEYWVSKAKHYCKLCNIWVADNKPSILHHESGVKHKINVQNAMKQKQNAKLYGVRSEHELQNQLAEIEKAARSAMQSENSNYVPPPPTNFTSKPFDRPKKKEENTTESNQANIEEPEDDGIYSIRGKTYLDGKIHDKKLLTGTNCEIFVEDIDEWISGTIIARNETPIPHTARTITTFDVSYKIPSQEDQEEKEVIEKDIKNDRIRLLISSIDDSTGIGTWQTVAVKTVNEEEEWKNYEEAVEKIRNNTDDKDIIETGKSKKAFDKDAYFERFNPLKASVYKGVAVEELNVKPQNDNFDDGDENQEIVSFKKRKIIKEEIDKNDTQPEELKIESKPKNRNYRKRSSD